MSAVGWVFVILLITLGFNTFFFVVHSMKYWKFSYLEPYTDHKYAMKTMFLFAIPGLFVDDDDDNSLIWRRIQVHIDNQRTNWQEIRDARNHLWDLEQNAPVPWSDAVRQQILDARQRLEAFRLMDLKRGSEVFLATRAADIRQQQERLAASLRIEASILGHNAPDALEPAGELEPAPPPDLEPRWRRVWRALKD